MLKTIRRYNLTIILILLMAIFGLINPAFLKLSNLANILSQNSIIGLVSLGMTLVIIIGGIDLSVGSIVALCGIAFASAISSGSSIWMASLLCLLIGCFVGFLNGILIDQGRIPAFITTLGIMSAARGGALLISNSRSIPLEGIHFNSIINNNIFGINISSAIFISLTAMLWLLLDRTYPGKYLYAIGDNEKAAHFNGISITKFTLIVYSASGMFCSVAAIMLVGTLNSAQPQAGALYELTAIAAVVVGGASLSGGKGSVVGTFIGVLILGVIQNGLSILNVPSYYQYILIGIIIILSVFIDKKVNQ